MPNDTVACSPVSYETEGRVDLVLVYYGFVRITGTGLLANFELLRCGITKRQRDILWKG